MDADLDQIVVVAPKHICGNGIRSTAEACDDNNTIGGDGCDAELSQVSHLYFFQ